MGGNCITKVASVFRFGHQGVSLFSNPNSELAFLGIQRGQNGKNKTIFLMYMGGIYIVKVALVFHFGHQGASLFSNRNSKLAVFAVYRGQMAKIRPFFLCKWGVIMR